MSRAAVAVPFADPFTCLVCLGASDKGWHFCTGCLPRSRWGSRFTYSMTSGQRAAAFQRISDGVGIGYAYAESTYDDLVRQQEDYSDLVVEFMTRLLRLDWAEHFGQCLDLTKLPADEFLEFWWWKTAATCPNCLFGITQLQVSLMEDRRHNLDEGATFAAVVAHNRKVGRASKLAAVASLSIEDIVTSAMAGAK